MEVSGAMLHPRVRERHSTWLHAVPPMLNSNPPNGQSRRRHGEPARAGTHHPTMPDEVEGNHCAQQRFMMSQGLTAFVARQFVLKLVVRSPEEVQRTCMELWRGVCIRKRGLWRVRIAIVSRRMHRLRTQAWNAWVLVAEDGTQRLYRLEMALLLAVKRLQSEAMRAWRHWAECRHAKLENSVSLLYFRARALMHRATAAWLGIVRTLKSENMRVIARADQKRAKWLRTAFLAWRNEWLPTRRGLAHYMARVKSHTCRRILKRGLTNFAYHAVTRMMRREKLASCAVVQGKIRNRSLQNNIVAWGEFVAETREIGGRISKALAEVRRERVWVNLCAIYSKQLEIQQEIMISRAEEHHSGMLLKKCFYIFVGACQKCRQMADSERVALSQRTTQCKRRHLSAWIRVYRDVILAWEHATNARKHYDTCLLRKVACEWKLCARTCAALMCKKDTARWHAETHALLRVVRFLHREVLQRRSKIVAMRRAVRHRYIAQLRCTWSAWGGKNCPSSYTSICRERTSEHQALMALHTPWLIRSVYVCGRAYVSRKRTKRAMRATGAVFWKKRLLRFGFWGWVLGLAQRDERRECKHAAYHRYESNLAENTLQCMLAYAQSRTHNRIVEAEKYAKARKHINARALGRLMQTWCSLHAQLVVKRMQNAIARGRCTHTLAGNMVKKWRQAIVLITCMRTTCRAMLGKVKRRVLQGCVGGWVLVAAYYAQRKCQAGAVEALYHRGMLAWCSGIWLRYVLVFGFL
jgi:hypothetical protein